MSVAPVEAADDVDVAESAEFVGVDAVAMDHSNSNNGYYDRLLMMKSSSMMRRNRGYCA